MLLKLNSLLFLMLMNLIVFVNDTVSLTMILLSLSILYLMILYFLFNSIIIMIIFIIYISGLMMMFCYFLTFNPNTFSKFKLISYVTGMMSIYIGNYFCFMVWKFNSNLQMTNLLPMNSNFFFFFFILLMLLLMLVILVNMSVKKFSPLRPCH